MMLIRCLLGTMKTDYNWDVRLSRDFNNDGGFRARITQLFQARAKEFPGVSPPCDANCPFYVLFNLLVYRYMAFVPRDKLHQAWKVSLKLTSLALMRAILLIIWRSVWSLLFCIGGYGRVLSQHTC